MSKQELSLAEVFGLCGEEDRDVARRVVEALHAEGLTVFWDQDLLPGQFYPSIFEAQLSSMLCQVIIWSAVARLNPFV